MLSSSYCGGGIARFTFLSSYPSPVFETLVNFLFISLERYWKRRWVIRLWEFSPGSSGSGCGLAASSCEKGTWTSGQKQKSSSLALQSWVGLGILKQMSPATGVLASSTPSIHLYFGRTLPRWPTGFVDNSVLGIPCHPFALFGPPISVYGILLL
jgi:hypothetical protein